MLLLALLCFIVILGNHLAWFFFIFSHIRCFFCKFTNTTLQVVIHGFFLHSHLLFYYICLQTSLKNKFQGTQEKSLERNKALLMSWLFVADDDDYVPQSEWKPQNRSNVIFFLFHLKNTKHQKLLFPNIPSSQKYLHVASRELIFTDPKQRHSSTILTLTSKKLYSF